MKIVFYACIFLACTQYMFSQSNHNHSTDLEQPCSHNYIEDHDSDALLLPQWSVVVDMSYLNRNRTHNMFSHLEIPGFTHAHTEGSHEDHAHSASEEGFNINYAEVSLISELAGYGELSTTFHLSESAFEIEEIFVKSKPFFSGLQLKFGKFYSGFGHINSQHAHSWNFSDMPLVNQAFFGVHGLLEKGIQLTWKIPIATGVMLGIENLQGENEMSFGTERIENDYFAFEAVSKPSITSLFFRYGFQSNVLRMKWGISYAKGDVRLNHLTEKLDHEDEEGHFFAGKSKLSGVDLSITYTMNSEQFLAFTGEYITRDMDGLKVENYDSYTLRKKQAGWYAEVIWGLSHNLRTGIRLDTLSRNDIFEDGNLTDFPESLKKTTIMLEWNPWEMSRIRLQYSKNKAAFFEGVQQDVSELSIQYTLIIGEHHHH